MPNRRTFLRTAAAAAGSLAALSAAGPLAAAPAGDKKFRISLAAWSLHRGFGKSWKNLDLPRIARQDFGIEGVEFVNSFFELPTHNYLQQLRREADSHGVELVLIMIDGEGDMSHQDRATRMLAARSHRKWVDIACALGCKTVRCNSGYTQDGTVDERIRRATESFTDLVQYADQAGINVTIENHGGYSSQPDKLLQLIKAVGHPRFGTLPDFGNFPPEVDKYEAVRAMMPYAKAVSAKCLDFAPDGSHVQFDIGRMVEIVLAAGYHGFIGIEYEGDQLSEPEGIMACKRLLERYQV